ncbi:SagB family peptide dehydrogenase [Halorussus halophilus]|uniref:SagB family peptide dehydrogenase n=1 Tax=Halorussus halophilus TaxID=2650975 RepID=UPI0013016968|nr:SagB family peptide dehydrogenase [Halorussus halophilus]
MVDAREYHEQTKHAPGSIGGDGNRMNPDIKPRPYKRYADLPRESISALGAVAEPALSAITASNAEPDLGVAATEIDAETLHTLCHYATGVTKELKKGGRLQQYRAASCTGKLYHIDLYAVTGDLGGFGPGVYHFDPSSDSFDVLREGDYRGVLAQASGDSERVADAPVTFVATSEWWRNAWKYADRTYRHAFWDSGTILANLLAAAHGRGHSAAVELGFADSPVTKLLGLDPEDEAPLELLSVGSGDTASDASSLDSLDSIDPEEDPVSDSRVEYPLVPDAWRQSTLDDGADARAWREKLANAGDNAFGTHGIGDGKLIDLDPVDVETASGRPVDNTIERRGSLREFSHEAISARKFATILDRALGGVPVTAGASGSGIAPNVLDYYCLVNAVEGIPSGAYQYHPESNALERLGDSDRETAGHIALDQSVVGDTVVNVYLVADVDALVDRLGNRGYRLAQLLGGVQLGRLYLATYAHRTLGGRGFTFYDDLVTEQFSPRAANQTPMTMFAFGKPEK